MPGTPDNSTSSPNITSGPTGGSNDYQKDKSTKDINTLDDDDYGRLKRQIDAEYNLAWRSLNSKLTKWLVRLKLYNNQKRDDDAIGDPLLFTIFQTVFASLYEDSLMVEWSGKNEGDEDVADNINDLAKYDYAKMQKDILDYNWIWDTLFFGRGLVEFSYFDRKTKTPWARVIDPTTWLRDPSASSVNGDLFKKGAMRFGGEAIVMLLQEMKDHPDFIKDEVDKLKPGKSDKVNSLIYNARQARADAQGINQQTQSEEKDLGENAQYELLKWYTYFKKNGWDKPRKVLVVLGNTRKVIVRFTVLKDQDDWPIIDRSIYPISHDWDGVSIPDLVEDKQRMRAIVQNLGVKTLKANLYPMYLFDKNRIKNRGDLNFNFNKFIPVDQGPAGGALENALSPVRKEPLDMNLYNLIMNSMDLSAQKATASPDMQQGVPSKQERTLGELNKVDQKGAARFSLAAKVFGWSEKRFWLQWYWLYKTYFKDNIDEKIIRLEGAFGPRWRPLGRDNIITKEDPDLEVNSKYLSESQKVQKRALFNEFLSMVAILPGSNIRYGLKKAARLHDLEQDEINRLIPPTPDELVAEDENKLLNEGKQVYVKPTDNHEQHLEVHAKAADTPEVFAHIQTHRHMIELKQQNPKMFEGQGGQQDQSQGGQPGQQPQQQPGQQPGGAPPKSNGTGGQQDPREQLSRMLKPRKQAPRRGSNPGQTGMQTQ